MKTTVLYVLVALGLSTATAAAQSPADFSGTWKIDPSFSIGATRAQRRNPIVSIRQDDRTLLIEQGTGAPLVYRLDGAESTSRSGRVRTVARSRWDHDRLVTVGARQSRVLWLPLGSRFAETRWLTAEGRTMVVEWQVPRQHHTVLRKLVFTRLRGRAE